MQFPRPFHRYSDLEDAHPNVERVFEKFKKLVYLTRHIVMFENHVHPEAPHDKLYKDPIEFPDEISDDFKNYNISFFVGNKTVHRRAIRFPFYGRAKLDIQFQAHERTADLHIGIDLNEGNFNRYFFNLGHFEEWIQSNTKVDRELCLFGFYYLYLTTPIGNGDIDKVKEAFNLRADAAKEIIRYNTQCLRNNHIWQLHFHNVLLPTVLNQRHPTWSQMEVLGNKHHLGLENILKQGNAKLRPYPWPSDLLQFCVSDVFW